MGCAWVRLNALPALWYTLVAAAVQAYLLYLAARRYTLYTEVQWPQGAYPRAWLTAYMGLLGACIPLLALFALTGCLRTGNLAGDNRTLRWTAAEERRKRRRDCFLVALVRDAWIHAPPLPQTLHVAAALLQLLAQQLMMAQLYRFGFINTGDLLNTELDFLFQRARQLATNLPMGDTRLQGFRITTEELTGSPLAPRLLPILMHARLFGIPLEFVNLAVALLAYMAVYPAVFWRLNKWFCFWFSAQLLLHSVDVVFTYIEFSILFRIQETNYYSIRPIGIGQHMAAASQLVIYLPVVILGTFVGTLVLMFIAPIIVYAYGYNKYYSAVRALEAAQPAGKTGGGAPHVGLLDDFDGRGEGGADALPRLCCDGYGPHAVAILLLVGLLAAKAPAIYALLLLHQHDQRPVLAACLLAHLLYLFGWILLWLLYTCKRDWAFQVPARSPYAPRPPVLCDNAHQHAPPPPTNLFAGPYQRTPFERNSPSAYHPDSYASIRRPLRPAGLMFAQNIADTSPNDYGTKSTSDYGKLNHTATTNTTSVSYGSYTLGRNSHVNTATIETYGNYGQMQPNGSPKTNYQPNQQKLHVSSNSITKPLISGANFTPKPNWEVGNGNGVYGKFDKTFDNPASLPPPASMTPSSTLTSQNGSTTSSFQPNGHSQTGQLTTLLMRQGSTSTLTQLDPNAQFATSVV